MVILQIYIVIAIVIQSTAHFMNIELFIPWKKTNNNI